MLHYKQKDRAARRESYHAIGNTETSILRVITCAPPGFLFVFLLVLGKGITILPDFRILSCLKVYLQDMGPFCDATDTPHLDFC